MTATTAPIAADLTALIEQVRSRTASAEDIVRESLGRTARTNPRTGAVLESYEDSALRAARHVDVAGGPLMGLPLGIKANIALAEAVPTSQSRVYDRGFHRGEDAEVVRRLRASGAAISCRTTMVEHAAGRPDPALGFPLPRNPWDLSRWPGGSSCGTAIAVSLGIIAAGLGTDTLGSCRIPAAHCGITGLRPTHGSVPMEGILPTAPALDVVGPMARSARDCRLLLEIMRGSPVGYDSRGAPPRILVPTQMLGSDRITPATQEAFAEALRTFEALGVSIDTVDVAFIDQLVADTMTIMVREMFSIHRDRLVTRWSEYGRSFRRLALSGALITDSVFDAALRSVRRLGIRLDDLLGEGAALALPTWPSSAPAYVFAGGAPDEEWNLTAAFSATGNPALAVPMGFDRAGLPLSLQLIGARQTAEQRPSGQGEDDILSLGELFQVHTDHHLQKPRLDLVHEVPAIPDPDAGLVDDRLGTALPPAVTDLRAPLTTADRVTLAALAEVLGGMR